MQRLLRALATTASILAAAALAPTAAHAQAPAAAPQMAQLLFVQGAAGVELGGGGRTLTLKGLSPTTLFFSDRPVRIAGHYRTEEYLQFWKNGPDSFLKDPPNATLSVFEKGKDELADVVVTLRNPRLSGNDLTYDATVISGTIPKAGGPASLFIDIIGLPFTPLSFAGVARRTAYRTVVWGGAAAASAAAASAYYHPPAPFYSAPVPVTYPVPVPTVHVTETIQAPPPPAPAVSGSQAAAVAKLKELKSLQSQGLITEAQYQAESQKLLNQIVQ
jgi:hypothetical protein